MAKAKVLTTKLSQVLAAMDVGDYRKAISIASKFHDLGPQKAAITRLQSLFLSESLYAQLGLDRHRIIEDGKNALVARFEPMRKRK
jgi:hypothetical protein